MVTIVFGERQGATGITTIPLAQGVVPAFLMVGLAAAFWNRMVLIGWHDERIDIEGIGEDWTGTIGVGDGLPQLAGSGFGAIPNGIRHNLTGAATLRRPQPAFEPFLAHKGHQLIHLQHIFDLRWQQGLLQTGQGCQPLFEPAQHGAAPHAKHPLQPTQTHPLPIGFQNGSLLLWLYI